MSVMEALHVPAAATVMSIVILTAVLSALNSGLFASSRMLMALARRGDAPAVFCALDPRGVPVAAILAGTAFGYAAVVMSYVSPDKVFAFLVNSYGTVGDLRLCADRDLAAAPAPPPGAREPGATADPHVGIPVSDAFLTIAGMLGIVAAMAFIPEQRRRSCSGS